MGKFELIAGEAVLLAIDFQERLMPAMAKREEIIRNAGLLLAAAEKLGLPVIVTEQYPRGLGKTVPEIKEYLKNHHLLEKMTFSAMDTKLKALLDSLDRKKIIVAGVETHVCVFQTVRDLVKAGFEVHVVEDAVGSRFKQNFKSGRELMRDLGAVITNTETVIFDLLKVAGSSEFREMSKLLK